MCWPQESAPGSEASARSTSTMNSRNSGSSGWSVGSRPAAEAVTTVPCRREELFELAPAEEPHRQVAVVLALGQDARAQDLGARLDAVAADEIEQHRGEVGDGADERHDREQHVAAGARDADELGDALLGAVDEVADRAAVADGGIEAPVVELLQSERHRR